MRPRLIFLALSAPGAILAQDKVPTANAPSHGDGKSAASGGARTSLVLERKDLARAPLVLHPVALDVDEFDRVVVAETYRMERRGVTDNRGKPNRVLDDLQTETLNEQESKVKRWLNSGELDKDLDARKSDFSGPKDGRVNFLTKYSEKVSCLFDDNGDGVADRRSDFADGFNEMLDGTAAGILTWDGNVYFACVPHLWQLPDPDRDGKANQKLRLATGFGIRSGWYGHDLHGLTLGMDGRIYFSVGDRGFSLRTREGRVLQGADTGAVFRCWPDGADLELVARGLRNPQELAFDDLGNLFTGDNNCDAGDKARLECILDGGDYGWEVSVQDLEHRGPWLREHLWELRREKSDPEYPAWRVPPVGHLAAGPSGFAAYPGIGLTDDYRDHFFLCDFRGGGNGSILAFRCEPAGASFKLTHEHLFETGVGVSDLAFGYDGRIYVSDWGNAWDLNDAGRIYTLTHEPSRKQPIVAETSQLVREGFSHRSIKELANLLEHADRRVRMKAQLALAARDVRDVLENILPVARKSELLVARLHALWTLGVLARHKPVVLAEVTPFLKDAEPELRAQAAKVLGDGRHLDATGALTEALSDENLRVRMYAALALARLAQPRPVEALMTAVRENDDNDANLRHALVAALAACATPQRISALAAQDEALSIRLAGVLALRRLGAPEVSIFLNDADAQIATEAARAIYDRNISAAMPELAAALGRSEFPDKLRNDAFFRRAIEANLRLGRVEDADRVAKFAALPPEVGISETHRLLALEALENWDSPPSRDGVWGRWMPLPVRAVGLARSAAQAQLPSLLKFADKAVLSKARALDNKLGSEKPVESLLAWAKDETQPENLRADYLRTLEARGQAAALQAEEACRSILAVPNSPPRLRVQARDLLVHRKPAETLPLLSDALLVGSPLEKQSAVMALSHLRSSEAEKKLLELGQQLANGTLDPSVQVEVLEIVRHRDEKRSPWRKILEHWDEHLDLASDRLALHRPSLQGGDPEAGRKIFYTNQLAQCLRCHAVRGQGGSVGPDLAGLASRQGSDYLLESLIVPSAKVVDGYGVVTVTLKDDKSVSGILQGKSDGVMAILEGTTRRLISEKEVKSITPPVSAMPPVGVLLTPRELRDLMAYLQTLK